jgi:hypothetical protein
LRSHHLKCGIGSKKAQVRCAVRILAGKGLFYLKSFMDISHLTSREKCSKKVIHLMDNELLAGEICILGAFCTFNVNSPHKVCACGTLMQEMKPIGYDHDEIYIISLCFFGILYILLN